MSLNKEIIEVILFIIICLIIWIWGFFLWFYITNKKWNTPTEKEIKEEKESIYKSMNRNPGFYFKK